MAAGAPPAAAGDDLFTRHTRSYTTGRGLAQLAVLNAGCTTATDLGTAALTAHGTTVTVTSIDDDQPVTRAAAASAGLDCVLGDLRAVPLPPRAFDIVQASLLLERIEHAELILDRLIAAMKPGGLLLLRFCDRDSAAGFLQRALPPFARRPVWRRRHPGAPGPPAAVCEHLASARGMQAYLLLRGLVVAERLALGGLAGGLPPGPPGYLAAQKLVAALSGGRLSAAHEELLYVVRKPENRYARLL